MLDMYSVPTWLMVAALWFPMWMAKKVNTHTHSSATPIKLVSRNRVILFFIPRPPPGRPGWLARSWHSPL